MLCPIAPASSCHTPAKKILHTFPHPALHATPGPFPHTIFVCFFGSWSRRRNMTLLKLSLVMSSDSSYSICLCNMDMAWVNCIPSQNILTPMLVSHNTLGQIIFALHPINCMVLAQDPDYGKSTEEAEKQCRNQMEFPFHKGPTGGPGSPKKGQSILESNYSIHVLSSL